jgi:hypothetical protein
VGDITPPGIGRIRNIERKEEVRINSLIIILYVILPLLMLVTWMYVV